MSKVVNVKVAHIRPQYNNLKEWCEDPNNVYIGRARIVYIDGERYPPEHSPYANIHHYTLEQYEEYIKGVDLTPLKGKTLGCWCKPNPCHGDVLMRLINGEITPSVVLTPVTSSLTVQGIKDEIKRYGVKIPNGLRKAELLHFLQALRQGHRPTEYKEALCTPIPYIANLSLDWKTHLFTHGWAITKVQGLDYQKVRSGLKDWVDINSPPYNLHGIFKHWVGHLPAVWETREACIPIFSDLWGTNDLLTSFDGFCYMNGRKEFKHWMHCDQGRALQTFCCVQGIVNLYPNGPNDGGTVLMSGSHHVFKEYLDKHPLDGIKGFFRIDPHDDLLKHCPIIKPCLEEGEILLFDSRTFHCNIPPKGNIPRMSVYVSMMPKSQATGKELEKRRKLYNEGRMTGHWCYGPYLTVVEKEPFYTKGERMPDITVGSLNEIQDRLVS